MSALRAVTNPPAQTITISGGAPSSTSVTIAANQDVVFQNDDNQDYLLQLWTQGNNHHLDICPVLSAGGSLTYYPDPNNTNGNGKCHYNVLTLSGHPTNPTATGSNVIIIGSGNE